MHEILKNFLYFHFLRSTIWRHYFFSCATALDMRAFPVREILKCSFETPIQRLRLGVEYSK